MHPIVVAKSDSDYEICQLNNRRHIRIWTLTVEELLSASMCIIFSPLTSEEIKLVEGSLQIDFFVYVGVRGFKNLKNIYRFNDPEDLRQQLLDFDQRTLQMLKSEYLKDAYIFSDSDADYLRYLKGEDTPKKADRKIITNQVSNKIPLHTCIVGEGKSFSSLLNYAFKNISSRALIIDCNLLKPSLDSIFGIDTLETKMNTQLSTLDNTGLNVLLDSMQKGVSINLILNKVVKRVNSNVDLVLGNYNMFNYEHIDVSLIRTLIKRLKFQYDIVYTIVPKNLYDELTLALLHDSDNVILISENSRVDVREIIGLKEILEIRQRIPSEKLKYVFVKNAFKNIQNNVDASSLKVLFKDQFLGCHSIALFKMRKMAKIILGG